MKISFEPGKSKKKKLFDVDWLSKDTFYIYIYIVVKRYL